MAMNSVETIRNGDGLLPATHDVQKKEESHCRSPVDKTPPPCTFGEPIEVDTDPETEYRVVVVEGDRRVVLEVDEDGDEDLEGNGHEEEEELPGHARSVYAMSTYPTVQPAHQVEYPFEYGMDAATMFVLRISSAPTWDVQTNHDSQRLVSNALRRRCRLHRRIWTNVLRRLLHAD